MILICLNGFSRFFPPLLFNKTHTKYIAKSTTTPTPYERIYPPTPYERIYDEICGEVVSGRGWVLSFFFSLISHKHPPPLSPHTREYIMKIGWRGCYMIIYLVPKKKDLQKNNGCILCQTL